MPDSEQGAAAMPVAMRAKTALAATLTATCVLLAADARATAERFRLTPGSTVLDDGANHEGSTGYANGFPYEVVHGHAIAEGDMVLGRVDASGRIEIPRQRRGLGQASLLDRWPDGVVPYRFHPRLSEIQTRNVQLAIAMITAQTRIEMMPADDPAATAYNDYLLFEPSLGCASYVGRQLNEDAQSLWVSDSCSVGSVVHEIAHALGLFHEHTRPDRDNYVSIDWERIVDGKAFNFEIFDAGVEMHGEYDYGSIMHYGDRFFSRDGGRTIIAPDNVTIGQRQALSADDVLAIDRMYATDLMLGADIFSTERGLEIDVSITNIGDLGARRARLRIRADDDTVWRSVSADSGWDCLIHDTELHCERDTLREQSDSRFTIIVDAGTADPDTMAFELSSRTLDTDLSNNTVNGAALDGEPEPTSVSSREGDIDPSADTERPAPTVPGSTVSGSNASTPDPVDSDTPDPSGSDTGTVNPFGIATDPDPAPDSPDVGTPTPIPVLAAAEGGGRSGTDDDGAAEEAIGANGPLALCLIALTLGLRRRAGSG